MNFKDMLPLPKIITQRVPLHLFDTIEGRIKILKEDNPDSCFCIMGISKVKVTNHSDLCKKVNAYIKKNELS